MAQAVLNGSRLAFVVIKQEGTVTRPVHKWTKKGGLQEVPTEKPAGYLVFFPRGHAIHIPDRETLRHYGLDKEPKIINLEGLNDPSSPIGQLLSRQDGDGRMKAYEMLERQVIAIAQKAGGKVKLTKDYRDKGEDGSLADEELETA